MFDNPIFDVNGEGEALLREVIDLAFKLSDHKEAVAWCVTPEHGLIFYWSKRPVEHVLPFPVPMSSRAIATIAFDWLACEQADNTTRDPRCTKIPSSSLDYTEGWQVYRTSTPEDKERPLPSEPYVILAVRPAWLHLGK